MSKFDLFLGMALAPFGLFVMLLVARPFLNLVRRMPDGRLKRLLLWRY